MPPTRKKEKSSRRTERKIEMQPSMPAPSVMLTRLDPRTIQWWTESKSTVPVPDSPSRNLRSQQQRYYRLDEPGTSTSPRLPADTVLKDAEGTNSSDTIIKVCKVQGNRIVEIERKVRATPSTSKPGDQRSSHTISTEKASSPVIKPISKRTARKSIRRSRSPQGSLGMASTPRTSTSGDTNSPTGTPTQSVKKVSPVPVRSINNSPKRLSSTRLVFPGSKTTHVAPPSPERRKTRKTAVEDLSSNVQDSPGKAERRSILWDILPEGRSTRSTRPPAKKMAASKSSLPKSNIESNTTKLVVAKDDSKQPTLQSRFHTRRTTLVTGRPPTPPHQVSSTTDATSTTRAPSLTKHRESSVPETSKQKDSFEVEKKNGSIEDGLPKQAEAADEVAEEKHDNIFSMLEQWEKKGTVVPSTVTEGDIASQSGDTPTEGEKQTGKGTDDSHQPDGVKSSPAESSPSISPTTRFKISVFKLKCPAGIGVQQTGHALSTYKRPKQTLLSTTIPNPSNFVSRSLTFQPKAFSSLQGSNESLVSDKPALSDHLNAKAKEMTTFSVQKKSRRKGDDGDLLCEEQMCDSDEFDSPRRRKGDSQVLSDQGTSSDSDELVPDVDDIAGVMFVSFTSKEAISAHSSVERETREKFGNELDRVLTELGQNKSGKRQRVAKGSPDSSEAAELYEKIATYERLLRAEVKRTKTREIVHPELSRKCIGLSHSPTLNLKELGVDMDVLQSPPRDSSSWSPGDIEHCDVSPTRVSSHGSILASILMAPKDRAMVGSAPSVRYPASPSDGHQFVSRTGKTTDITKIKGWKSKLAILSSPPKKTGAMGSGVSNQTATLSSATSSLATTKRRSVPQKPKAANQFASGKVTKKKKAKTGLASIPEGSSIKVVSKEMVEHWQQLEKMQKRKKKKPAAPKEKYDSNRPFGRFRPPKTPDHPTPPLRQFTSNVVTATMALKAVMAVCTSPQDMNMEEKESHHAMVQKLENPQEVDKSYLERRELVQLPPCGKEYCQLGCLCDSLSSGWQHSYDREHCNEPGCMLYGCTCEKSSPEARRISILKDDHEDDSNEEKVPKRRPQRRVTAKSLSYFNALNYEYYPEFSTSPPRKKKSQDSELYYSQPKKKKSQDSEVEMNQGKAREKKAAKPYQPRDKKTGKFLKKILESPQPAQQSRASQPLQRFKQVKPMPLFKPLKSQQPTAKADTRVERTVKPVVEPVNTRLVPKWWFEEEEDEDDDDDDDVTMTCARARVHKRTAKTRPCSCGVKHHHHHSVSQESKKSPGLRKSPEAGAKLLHVGKKASLKELGNITIKHREGQTKPSSQSFTCVKVFKQKPQGPTPQVSEQGKGFVGRSMQIGSGIIGALAASNSPKAPQQNLPSKATVLKLMRPNPNAPRVYVPVSSTLEKAAELRSVDSQKLPIPAAGVPGRMSSVSPTIQQSSGLPSSQGSVSTPTGHTSSAQPQHVTKPGQPSKIPVANVPQYPQSQLILIEQKTTNPAPGPGKQPQQVVHSPKLVEIISTCNWDSARNVILKMIAQQSQNLSLPHVFQVGDFLIEVMGPSQERRIYNLPANLLQTLPPRIQSARVKIWKQVPWKTGKIAVPPGTALAVVKGAMQPENPASNPSVKVQNQAGPIQSMPKTPELVKQPNILQKAPSVAPNVQEKLTAEPAKQAKLTEVASTPDNVSESVSVNEEAKTDSLEGEIAGVSSQEDLSAVGPVLPMATNKNTPPPTPVTSGSSMLGRNVELKGPGHVEDVSNTTGSLSQQTTATASCASSVVQDTSTDDKEIPAISSDVPLPQEESAEKGEEPDILTQSDDDKGDNKTAVATEAADECEAQPAAQVPGNSLTNGKASIGQESDNVPTSTKVVTTTTVAKHGDGTAVQSSVGPVLSTKPVTATRESVCPDEEPHIPSDAGSTECEGTTASPVVDEADEGMKGKSSSFTMETDAEDNTHTCKDELSESEQKQEPVTEETAENNTSLAPATTTGMDYEKTEIEDIAAKPAASLPGTKENNGSKEEKLMESTSQSTSEDTDVEAKPDSAADESDNTAANEDNILESSSNEAIIQKQPSSDVKMSSLEQPEEVAMDQTVCADDVKELEASEDTPEEGQDNSKNIPSLEVNDQASSSPQKELMEDALVDPVVSEGKAVSQIGQDKDENSSVAKTKQVESCPENQPSKVLTSGTFIPENPLDNLISRVAASIASAEKTGDGDPTKKIISSGTFIPENALLEADDSESSEESEDSTSSSESFFRKSMSSEEESNEGTDQSPEDPVHSPSPEESKEMAEGDQKTIDDGAEINKAADSTDSKVKEMVSNDNGKESKDNREESSGVGTSPAVQKSELPEKTESPKSTSPAIQKSELPEKTESPKKIATSGIFVPTVATHEQNQWLENQATHTSTDQHHEVRHQEQNNEGRVVSKEKSTSSDKEPEEVTVISSDEDNVDVDGLQAPSLGQKRKADSDLVDIIADDDDEDGNTLASVKLRLSIAASGEVINPQCSVHSLKVKKKRKSVVEEFEPDDVEFIEKGREELMAEAAEARKSVFDKRLGVSRLLHISNERRRRREIKDLFGNLKVMLGIPNEDDRVQVANITVLKRSKEMIDKLKKEESQLSGVRQHLLTRRKRLIKRMASIPESLHSEAELLEKFQLRSEEPGFFARLMSGEGGDSTSESEEEDDSSSSTPERSESPPQISRPHSGMFRLFPPASSKTSDTVQKSKPSQPYPHVEETSILRQEFLKQLEKMKKGEELPEPKTNAEDKMETPAVRDAANTEEKLETVPETGATNSEMEMEVPRAKPFEQETQETGKRKLTEEDTAVRPDAHGGRLRKKARKSTFRKTNVNRRTITPQQLSDLEQTPSQRDNDKSGPGTEPAKQPDHPVSQLTTADTEEHTASAADSSIPSKNSTQRPSQSAPLPSEVQGTSSLGMQTYKINGGVLKSIPSSAASGAKRPNILRTTRPQTPTQSQDSSVTPQGMMFAQWPRRGKVTIGQRVKQSFSSSPPFPLLLRGLYSVSFRLKDGYPQRTPYSHTCLPLTNRDLLEMSGTCKRAYDMNPVRGSNKTDMLMSWLSAYTSIETDNKSMRKLHDRSRRLEQSAQKIIDGYNRSKNKRQGVAQPLLDKVFNFLDAEFTWAGGVGRQAGNSQVAVMGQALGETVTRPGCPSRDDTDDSAIALPPMEVYTADDFSFGAGCIAAPLSPSSCSEAVRQTSDTSVTSSSLSTSGIQLTPASAATMTVHQAVHQAATMTNVPILQLATNAPQGQPIFLENCDFLPAGGVIAVPIQGASSPITTAGPPHLTSTKVAHQLVPLSSVGNAVSKQPIKVVSVSSSSSPVLSSSIAVPLQKTPVSTSTPSTTTTTSTAKTVPVTSATFNIVSMPSGEASVPSVQVVPVVSKKGVGHVAKFPQNAPDSTSTPSTTTTSTGNSATFNIVSMPRGETSAPSVKAVPVVSKKGVGQVTRFPLIDKKTLTLVEKTVKATKPVTIKPKPLLSGLAKIVTLPVGTILGSKVMGTGSSTAKVAPASEPKENVTMVKDLSQWTTLQMVQDNQSGFLTAKMKLKGAGVPGSRNGPKVDSPVPLEEATIGVTPEDRNTDTKQRSSGKCSTVTTGQTADTGGEGPDVDALWEILNEDSSKDSASTAAASDKSQNFEAVETAVNTPEVDMSSTVEAETMKTAVNTHEVEKSSTVEAETMNKAEADSGEADSDVADKPQAVEAQTTSTDSQSKVVYDIVRLHTQSRTDDTETEVTDQDKSGGCVESGKSTGKKRVPRKDPTEHNYTRKSSTRYDWSGNS